MPNPPFRGGRWGVLPTKVRPACGVCRDHNNPPPPWGGWALSCRLNSQDPASLCVATFLPQSKPASTTAACAQLGSMETSVERMEREIEALKGEQKAAMVQMEQRQVEQEKTLDDISMLLRSGDWRGKKSGNFG